jgi:nucleoside-diphosphate-sugar epimerase
VLDPAAVREAITAARLDAIVHQATALSGMSDIKHFDRSFAPTNRLRSEGTDALLAAAREAGVDRFVAQSFAG